MVGKTADLADYLFPAHMLGQNSSQNGLPLLQENLKTLGNALLIFYTQVKIYE